MTSAERGASPLILVAGIAVVAAVVGFFLISQTSVNNSAPQEAPETTTTTKAIETTTQEPVGNFEFLNPSNYTKLASLPFGSKVHIVVASSGTPDVRTLRPIRIVMTVADVQVWEGTLDNLPTVNGVTKNCRGATGCSMDGPTIGLLWKGKKIEVKAYGANNELLATYSE